MKRYRAPRAKTGELKAQWGKLPGDNPDVCYVWGDGSNKRDAHLLHNFLTEKRMRFPIGNEPGRFAYADSFMEELKARGYDLTTLKFSIRKQQ